MAEKLNRQKKDSLSKLECERVLDDLLWAEAVLSDFFSDDDLHNLKILQDILRRSVSTHLK